MRYPFIPVVLAVSFALATPATAQSGGAQSEGAQVEEAPADAVPAAQAATAQEGAARLSIGMGIGRLADYEGSDDERWSPIPAANGTVAGMSFTLLGNRASLDLIPDGSGKEWNFQLGPTAVLNLNRTKAKAIADDRVAALGEVDMALEVGGYVGIGKTGIITSDYDTLSVSLSYRHDVTKIHKSGIWSPSINYTTPLSTKALVGLFASAEFVEDRYARTYFGVTPRGSTASGLPVFMPKGGQKDISFGGMFTHALTGNLTKGTALVVGANYKKLIGDFARSPLVSVAGSRHNWTVGAGIAATF